MRKLLTILLLLPLLAAAQDTTFVVQGVKLKKALPLITGMNGMAPTAVEGTFLYVRPFASSVDYYDYPTRMNDDYKNDVRGVISCQVTLTPAKGGVEVTVTTFEHRGKEISYRDPRSYKCDDIDEEFARWCEAVRVELVLYSREKRTILCDGIGATIRSGD